MVLDWAVWERSRFPSGMTTRKAKTTTELRQRLPQLDAVAVAVFDPGEFSVALVLALGVDPDASGGRVPHISILRSGFAGCQLRHAKFPVKPLPPVQIAKPPVSIGDIRQKKLALSPVPTWYS